METVSLDHHVIPKQIASVWWHAVFVPITVSLLFLFLPYFLYLAINCEKTGIVCRFSHEVVILSDIIQTLILLTFYKTFQYKISQKMFQWKSSHSMQVGGQMTELAVVFHVNFADTPKNMIE